MNSLRRTSLRLVLILALAIGVSAVAALGAAHAHGHAGPGSDACNLCQFSHLPFALGGGAPEIWPPSEGVQDVVAVAFSAFTAKPVGLVDGRAPPLS